MRRGKTFYFRFYIALLPSIWALFDLIMEENVFICSFHYILDEVVCVSVRINALGKGMNLSVLPPDIDKIVNQTMFFSLGEATSLRKRELVSHPAKGGGVSKYILNKVTLLIIVKKTYCSQTLFLFCCLFSLFNGIWTFMCYLMAKLFLLKNGSRII